MKLRSAVLQFGTIGVTGPMRCSRIPWRWCEIGASETKNKLGQLLDWVEVGEKVVITRRGRVVPRLVPPRPAADPEQARNATAAIRVMKRGVTLGGLKVKDLVAEGREHCR